MFCEICKSDRAIKNTQLLDIARHLSKTHKFSKNDRKEYYDKYLKKENEGRCHCGRDATFKRMTLGYSKYCSNSCGSKISIKTVNNKNWSNKECRERMLKNLVNAWLNPIIVEKIMKSRQSFEFRQKCSNRMKKLWSEDTEYRKKMLPVLCKNYLISEGINRAEQKLFDLIKEIGINFEYVGDGSKPIAGKFPDFINEEKRLIVELYGDYWHRNETEEQTKKRIDLFKSKGYDTLIVWEKELKDLNSLHFKINGFVNCEGLKCATKC